MKNLPKIIKVALLTAGIFGCGLFCHQANAAGNPITGSIDFGGVVTFDTMSLATATKIIQWNNAFVLQDSGSFSGISPGTSVTMAPSWTFNSGTASAPQPGPATGSLWSVGGFTFDLSSSMVVSQSANFLNVTGTGTLRGNGFDDTPGTWSFTASDSNGQNQSSFGFQSQATAVPETSTMILFGIGIVGLGAGRFMRKRTA